MVTHLVSICFNSPKAYPISQCP